ncbi:hypothetical protein B6N60_00270 [Richelia sinica FACHB-800]|uniref:PEP-CTERM sorting domain-containing protein n=1 Tax=Richelia sinica FACHB-800 TaxID=1357546 RepID=A0A975T504_9NOST|nr:PEP-CTERM sorting domain-containing protein [Richelia sinica]MBD2665829.1 PEP-CTERM sorting domain-containing protein [Richelia sinica FACHB-800]QXE21593.1 hypothetical protein B6N60_00270 [Richelia sinica FACHB-800]
MNFTRSKSAATISALGLSAIALFAGVKPANAADTCGPGANWVNNCDAGVDHFSHSWAYIDLQLLNPSGPPTLFDNIMFSGPVKVTRDKGENGIIKTILSHTLKGKLNDQEITLTADGTGEIQDIDGDGLASSFFDVFVKIDTPFGIIGNQSPLRVDGDRPLIGVSPSNLLPPYDPTYGVICPPPYDPYDPDVAVAYCGNNPLELFLIDANGNFGQQPVAILLNEIHIVHPEKVPEPISVIGAGLAFGFGILSNQKSGRKIKKQAVA